MVSSFNMFECVQNVNSSSNFNCNLKDVPPDPKVPLLIQIIM